MIKIMKFVLIFILTLFFIGKSYAVCTRNDTPGITQHLDMGTIVVSPNIKVGELIYQQSWPISQAKSLFYCTAGSSIDGNVNTSILTSDNNKIYKTNIPGIGIRLSRLVEWENVYSYSYTVDKDNNVNLAASQFIVRLYKTDEYVGSGPLTGGLYTWYGPSGEGVSASGFTTYMSENGTTIVSPSCSVASGAQQNVYLETVNYTQLKTVGSTAGDTNFSIQLKCSGGASLSVGYDNVSLMFTGTIPSTLVNSDGVLVNDANSNGAQGVGIQVLDTTKKAIEFDKKYTIGSLTGPQESYYITSNYTARYYRYGNNITPGAVQAKMIFGINYD